ncbi:MAG: ABC transporter permease [Gammaproteobacteria bacterium]
MSLLAKFAMATLMVFALLALVAPWLPLQPDAISLPQIMEPPSLRAWFGCDDLGRSIGARLMSGMRTSLLVAAVVVPLSVVIGTSIGAIAGWRGGVVDMCVARMIDVLLAFPGMLLAIALAGLLGPGVGNVVIALTVTGWVAYARLARAQTHAVKNREHIQAARALGTPTVVILAKHVLPLIAAPLLAEATLGMAGVMLAESGLSFLGLGVQPPSASLGAMLRDGTAYMLVAPHMVVAPGLVLLLLVLSCNVLGDESQRRLDPRAARADRLPRTT